TERGQEKPRLDPCEHVAFLDLLAFAEQHLLKLAFDLGVDRHCLRRLHCAEATEIDRYVSLGCHRHGSLHRHGARFGLLTSGALRPLKIGGAARAEHDQRAKQKESCPSQSMPSILSWTFEQFALDQKWMRQ